VKKLRWNVMAVLVVLIAAAWFVPSVLATALTAARDTPARTGNFVSIGVYTNTRIFAGAMVAINTNGYAVAAADSSGLNVIGMATETVDNRVNAEGAGDSGTLSVTVARGVFRWVNGDTFTDADIGDLAFVEDDQTVQKAAAASADIIAGVVLDVDSSGVWVDTYDIGAQGASAPSSLAVSGNATVGGTLGVTGAMSADGGIACDTDKFTVADTSGNTAIAGTLGVTGVATFTAESVHNGGLDTDYVTTDAAAGVDTKTAGTLLLGAATATKVEVGDAGVETEVQGGLDLQQGLVLAYANKTGNYTNATTDLVLSYNTSAVTTNTLPEASTVLGQLFAIALQDDDGDLVVVTDGTDTFDGTNNKITFADAGDSLLVIATGANVYTILVNVGGTLGTL